MNKDNQKTLEDVVRDKIATGYDPIKLQAKVKSNNEENVELIIEGQTYSIRGNAVTHVGKRASVEGGNAGEQVNTNPVGKSDGGDSDPVVSPPHSNPMQQNGETVGSNPLSFDDRKAELLRAYGAANLRPINEADATSYGDLIYSVDHENGESLATGTIEELESILNQNAKAAEAAA